MVRRTLAMCAVVATVAATTPRFLLDSAASIQRMSIVGAVGLTAWWLLPLVAFLLSRRSTPALAMGGGGYAVVAAVALADVYRSNHSTAAIGLFFYPPYLAAGLVVLALVDRIAAPLLQRHLGRP